MSTEWNPSSQYRGWQTHAAADRQTIQFLFSLGLGCHPASLPALSVSHRHPLTHNNARYTTHCMRPALWTSGLSTQAPRAAKRPSHKINPKTLKPGLVASYDIGPGNGEGLFWFLALHKLVTYLIRHLPTYLQPWDSHRACMPFSCMNNNKNKFVSSSSLSFSSMEHTVNFFCWNGLHFCSDSTLGLWTFKSLLQLSSNAYLSPTRHCQSIESSQQNWLQREKDHLQSPSFCDLPTSTEGKAHTFTPAVQHQILFLQ